MGCEINNSANNLRIKLSQCEKRRGASGLLLFLRVSKAQNVKIQETFFGFTTTPLYWLRSAWSNFEIGFLLLLERSLGPFFDWT